MASFRGVDMSPDPNVKQGSRIVHPIYARYGVKDSKGNGEDKQKSVNDPAKNITPTNFPINVRLCNRLKNIDSTQTVSSNRDTSGYYKQNTKEDLYSSTESRMDSEDEMNASGPSTAGNEHLTISAKDNITEKNKKSSIEQKRFYQRKLSGFSPVKFLPVGKLFKFLRPPLQRRNSCPVLSVSESEAEAKLSETLAKRNASNGSKQLKPEGPNERNHSCRLTKWTSHQELQRQEKVKNSPNSESEDLEKRFKATKHLSFKVAPEKTSVTITEDSFLRCKTKNALSKPKINDEASAVGKEPNSPVIEKTVIIVSENTTILQKENEFCESNVHVKSENVNIINGVGISMNSVSPDFTSGEKSKQNSNHITDITGINSNQPTQGNNITILSSDSTLGSSSRLITRNNNVEKLVDNTISAKDNITKTHLPPSDNGTLHNYSDYTNRDINIETSLNVQNNQNGKVSESNLCSKVGDDSNRNYTSSLYRDGTSEYIKIKPSKANNILYTKDAVNKSFSTFKSDPKPCTTVTVQSNGGKTNESELKPLSEKKANDSIIPNPYSNFTLVSANSQQNSKLQNGGNRKIYLPNGVTNGVVDDTSNQDNDACDLSDISLEFQTIFNKLTTERKVENEIKSCDTSSSLDNKTLVVNKSVDDKIPQPQLISITCTNKNNNTNHRVHKSPDIKVSVVNGTSVQSDTLDFGERSSNTSSTELRTEDINECYNVKLDAPEEVIVAGFHDFCHTMLSLEENLDSHDTGTVKRRKLKPKTTATEENEKKDHCNVEIKKIFNNDQNTNSSDVKKMQVSNGNIPSTLKQDKRECNNSSDKLLEEIQNSKLLEKMNIRDPDVIDAITALDNSLREASEQPILTQQELKEIESKLVATKNEAFGTEAKRRANVVREDKIQCDNLIEEVLLEDISKRVPSAHKKPAPAPPKRGTCIAVTISNSNAQQVSSLPQNTPIHHLPEIKDTNMLSSDRRNSSKSSSFNSQTNDSIKSSDYSFSGDMKRVNVLPDAKDDSSSLPASISSEEMNPTLPLQVSVDNNGNGGLQDVVACSRTSPCSVDSGTSSHNQGYFVVVAIDFGTTYSGYAFSFTRDPDNIHMMKKWDGGDPGVWNQKTPTTLLLSPEGTFHSFGFSARDYYHDLDVEEAQGWLYFEKFKMTLHNSEHLSLDTEIAAANGKRMPAVTVFAHALRYFKDHALQELSDQSATRILNEDVRWVVTVPAIWKQPAKQFMRAAAYKAGIASPEFPDQLLIALEPEAASIYCRRMRLHQLIPDETQYQRSLQWQKDRDTESEIDSTMTEKDIGFPTNIGQGEGSFTVGTRYMVVDCGGGTVDITVHELLDKQGTLKELQKASGGPYGSLGVDMEFENFLCDIFGRDFMQHFKIMRPTGYVDLMIAFESRKRNASPYKNNPLNISLPFSFIDCFVKYKGCSVEAAIKKSNHKNIKWSQGMLRLEPSAMEALFQKTIEQIRKHIEEIISLENLSIDYIFLVGGFAESLILQKEIKEAFSSKLKVVIPQGVSLAILKGAVLFGLDPTTVNIRRLRMTYGVGVLNHFIHGVHPREKLVIKNGKQWCADVFDKFVVNEQSVGVGDVVVRRYTPAKDGQSCSVMHIYCSEKDNVYFITDPGVKRCATLILDLSDSRYIQSREIQTRMMFGDTEIKVSALDVTTGKCVKAEVDFLNH